MLPVEVGLRLSFGNHDVAFPVERHEERLVAQVGLATGAGGVEAFFNGLGTGLTHPR